MARLAAPVARPTQTDTARGRRSARIFRQALGPRERGDQHPNGFGDLERQGDLSAMDASAKGGEREHFGSLHAAKIPFIPRLRETQYGQFDACAGFSLPSGIKCHGALLKLSLKSSGSQSFRRFHIPAFSSG